MCGIAGLVSRHAPPDPALVERMIDALRHRGPDEGGVDALGRCVLGHRRLKVIDLDTGSQPVTNEQGDVTCVFNGELYEFRALREELAATGHRIPGTGDTPRHPARLRGARDGVSARSCTGCSRSRSGTRSRDRLVLARDRIGKKPLLYAELPDGTLAFASELKALLRLPALARELDLDQLDAFLALQYVPGPETALRGVEEGAAGSRARLGERRDHGRAVLAAGGAAGGADRTRSGSSSCARRSARQCAGG